jgi:hypothetical protein
VIDVPRGREGGGLSDARGGGGGVIDVPRGRKGGGVSDARAVREAAA